MKRIETPRWGKPGNIALMAPAGLLMLMGVGAFVFDLGYIGLERSRLQVAADAATTAAARKLDGTQQGITNARTEAAALVSLNDPQNIIGFDKNRDMTFGYWDEDARTFDSTAPINVQNAVKINLERSRAHNNALEPFFARIVGLSSMEAYAQTSVYVTSSFSDPTDTEGVPGGHFDVDTDHLTTLLPRPLKTNTTCASTSCTQLSDGHIHQYDNTFDTRVFDSMNPQDASGSSNPGTVRSIQADTGTNKFKIIIANANLSPGVDIIINGQRRSVKTYAAIPFADLPTFGPSNALTELKIEMLENSLDTASVHRTMYDCAWNNLRGADGEWRNGALTVQAIQVASTGVVGSINGTISSTIPKAGGQGIATNGLLHEVFMFWHASWRENGNTVNAHCYSDKTNWDSDWIKLGTKKAHFVKF